MARVTAKEVRAGGAATRVAKASTYCRSGRASQQHIRHQQCRLWTKDYVASSDIDNLFL
jgi:hypothetical protein